MKYFLSLLGLGLLIGTFFLTKSTIQFTNESIEVRGSVIDLIEMEGEESSTYAPLILFYTQSGEPVEFKSSTSSYPPSYYIDEGVDVLYTPKDPYGAKIKSFFSLWGGPLFLGIFGVIISFIGFAALFSKERR